MFESVQKIIPWMSDLPTLPKLAVTAIVVLLACIVLYLVWVPLPVRNPTTDPNVKEAYARMQRVLSRIGGTSEDITVDGTAVFPIHNHYYKSYWAIAQFIASHPGEIKGAYDTVWENGGRSRTFTTETQSFEAVVSAFMKEWDEASQSKKK